MNEDTPGICERCDERVLLYTLREEWTGLMVCRNCFDHRHPQERVRGVPERVLRNPLPEPPDVFIEPTAITPADL